MRAARRCNAVPRHTGKASKQPIRTGRLPYTHKEMSRSQAIVDSARKWRQDAIEGRYDAAARELDQCQVLVAAAQDADPRGSDKRRRRSLTAGSI